MSAKKSVAKKPAPVKKAVPVKKVVAKKAAVKIWLFVWPIRTFQMYWLEQLKKWMTGKNLSSRLKLIWKLT